MSVAHSMVIAPGPNPIVLGGVTFSHEECPEKFPVGAAEQMLVVHNLPGGGITTNAFGNKPKRVTWMGHFFAGNIEPRVKQLRLYQVAGQRILLSWGFESYYVIIREFDPGYLNGYNEYSITVELVAANNGAFAVASPTSIDQQVAALQAQASTQNAEIVASDATGSAVFQPNLASVSALLAEAIPLAQMAAQDGGNILAAIAIAVTAIQLYQTTIGGGAPQYANTIALIAALQAIAANVSQGQAPQILTILGGDLFAIASQYYGDPSLAFALQSTNGLPSPFLSNATSTTIILPPACRSRGVE